MRLPFYIRRVEGHSMQPTLAPDQIVLVAGWLKPRRNDLVVAKAGGLEVIKRVAKVEPQAVGLAGDNPAHGHYGTVSKDHVLGRVLLSV